MLLVFEAGIFWRLPTSLYVSLPPFSIFYFLFFFFLQKLLGKKMANFHVILSGVWTKDNGWQELTKTVKSNAQKKHKPGKGMK